MAEVKGFYCDGGCGARITLDFPTQSLADRGWFTTFTPHGLPTLYTCSDLCLVRALTRMNENIAYRTIAP